MDTYPKLEFKFEERRTDRVRGQAFPLSLSVSTDLGTATLEPYHAYGVDIPSCISLHRLLEARAEARVR